MQVNIPGKTAPRRQYRGSDLDSRRVRALTAQDQLAIGLLQERRTALIAAVITGKIDVRGLADSEAV
jgi:hypothetical protein